MYHDVYRRHTSETNSLEFLLTFALLYNMLDTGSVNLFGIFKI